MYVIEGKGTKAFAESEDAGRFDAVCYQTADCIHQNSIESSIVMESGKRSKGSLIGTIKVKHND